MMEMETRAREDISMSQDITPPLPPLSFVLHDFLLPSRCSACSSTVRPEAAETATAISPFVVYCSAECASNDSSFHFSSAEYHLSLLLDHHPSSWPHGDSSDLRASLRLLRRLELLNLLTPLPLPGRIAGLMTNRESLSSSREEESANEDSLGRIEDGARAMAMARAMRDAREFDGHFELEEAVMCIVLTNAVEVQIGEEPTLGIAVYDGRFSWINHCCSPNACYRFTLCSGDLKSSNHANLLIQPATRGVQIEDDSIYSLCEPAKGCSSNGPRLVVRSIKMMRRGDEVTITYTDLMQPRMTRQSDLWLKYRFLCSCTRCNAALSYVDNTLQEIFHVDQHLAIISSANRDRFVEEMREYFDSILSEFMSAGNSDYVPCCEKIENLLMGGLLTENLYLKKPYAIHFRLSPIHHLSLSAYTALSSAYKIQSSLAENAAKAFNMRRISTAYSLLLAGATHHLYISDPSLIASAANFWTNAGESLICLAQSFWPSFVNQPSPNCFSLASFVCDHCLLTDKFKANAFCFVAEHEELNKVSQQFLQCATSITPKVWSFLAQYCCFLAQIKDPIDFSWLQPLRASNVWKFCAQSIQGEGRMTHEVRRNIFLLGAHCLMYGSCLSGVCYGQDSSAANYHARKILYG